MAAAEIYDYVSTVTADYSATTMTLEARGQIREKAKMSQVIHEGEDTSEERITLSSTPVYFITIPYNALTESDAGIVFDFWSASAKGMGRGQSFQYTHKYGSTTHTYVVRFDCDLDRAIALGNIHSMTIILKVLGRIADA